MNKFKKIGRLYAVAKLIGIFLILFAIVAVYVLININIDSTSMLKTYMSLSTSQYNSNIDRKYSFVSSYTAVTGDIQLAMAMGYTEDQAKVMASYGTPSDYMSAGSYAGTGFDFAGTIREQAEQLKTNPAYNNAHYQNKLVVVNINGRDFAYESQSSGAWSSYAPDSSTVSGAGCFWYASCAMVGAIKGEVYTIEQMCADNGTPVVTDSYGMFVPAVSSSYPFDDLGGSVPRLNQILSNGGTGASATEVLSIDWSKLSSGHCGYIIYATSDSGSSTMLYSTGGAGAHWTAVVGISNYGNAIVLCNGSRGGGSSGTEVPIDQFASLKYIYEVTW